jgi:hypothetical protein
VSGFAGLLLGLLRVVLILAVFRVDTPMLSGGNPATWHGWVHGIAFLLIIATGLLPPMLMHATRCRGRRSGADRDAVRDPFAGGVASCHLAIPGRHPAGSLVPGNRAAPPPR